MYTSEKNTKQLTVRGGGVNPYGQPDRKISVFFYDFPKHYSESFIKFYEIKNWQQRPQCILTCHLRFSSTNLARMLVSVEDNLFA